MTAKEFVLDYITNHPDNLDTDGDPLYENLREFFYEMGGEYCHSEDLGSSRWWDNLFVVQKINDCFVGYRWAATTGDNNIWDVGWEFNEDSLCFVEPYEETVVLQKYRKIS